MPEIRQQMIADDIVSEPYAVGHSFTVNPDDDLRRFTVSCEKGLVRLYDGRMNHNNGWFVLSIKASRAIGFRSFFVTQ